MNITNSTPAFPTYNSAETATSPPKNFERGNHLPPSSDTVTISGTSKSIQAAQNIMANYNVNNISPRDMAAMSNELYSSNNISLEEHAMLSFQPELNAKQPIESAAPDAKRDFINEWERKLEFQKQYGAPKEFIDRTKNTLNLLVNLNSMHQA